ncbi:hypothetical protein IE077_004422 [Cardiosporidium cionae]|uniref:UAS domain-containing protein n=1 Tax=Cardiosporidium cionae TaxID=476202 RepID=A0ABQ7JA60_9APIC|nr:hypothetical protein IE077_004422 [Cardiosporidium cionae]|eukprot:KAF8820845.1 hypothetical protein IE077_004422 [Cardiosporidium cionae]
MLDPDEIYSQKLLSDTGERTQFNRLNMGNIFAADTQNKEERPQRGLSALFAPPVEMNCEKPFETVRMDSKTVPMYINCARELACSSQRWLLVNIQRNDNFYCHRLNRDIWSNESVREVLKSHYVFWQREAENDEAADLFCELYDVTDFPYVAVIDPRTVIEFTEAPVRKVYPPTVAASADISPLENNVRSQIPQHTRVHQEAEQFRDEDSLPEEQPSLSNVNRG